MGTLPTTGTAPALSGITSFSGWAQATLGAIHALQLAKADSATIRAKLLEQGQQLDKLLQGTGHAGFRKLGLEDRARLEQLADPSVTEVPLNSLSATLQRVASGGFWSTLLIDPAPADLVPGQKPPLERSIRGVAGGSPTLKPGGTVIGQGIELGLQEIKRATRIDPPEQPFENEPGCLRNTRTVHADLPRPNSVAEKEQLVAEAAKEDNPQLEAYYDEQMRRMPAGMVTRYEETAEQIAKLNDRYEAGNEEVLRAIEAAGGRPSPKAFNEAKDNLERAIYESQYLSRRGIDPTRFSILEARHEAELYRQRADQDPEVAASLHSQALALEAGYVYDTLAGMATVARQIEKNEDEFHRLDLLAAHAKRVYTRVLAGHQILATDTADLAFFREHVFPFDQAERAIQWHSPAMGPVLKAMEDYRTAEQAYEKSMNDFLAAIAPATWKQQELRTKLTLEREELDFRFQQDRFNAEFERIRAFAAAQGQPIDQAHADYFAEVMALLADKHADNIKYWRGLASGEDVTARPHSRNSKNKGEMALLAYVMNIFLEDLYRLHNHPTRPSWISFADNNVFTALDEAIGRGIDPNDVRAWLADFMDKFGLLKAELGLTMNKTLNKWFRLSERMATDRHFVHAKAVTAGDGFRKGHSGKTVIYGLKDQASVSLRQTPHTDLELSDPEKKIYAEGFFKRLQHYLLPVLALANHTGIEEFRIFVWLASLGLPTPQLMQGGAANMPLAGPYGAGMSGILDRSKGADAVVELLYEVLLYCKEAMFYLTGTRDGLGIGFPHYRNPRKIGPDGRVRYSNLHAPRVIPDGYATGLEARIAMLREKRFKGHGRPIVLQPVIHNGNQSVPEKTWNLDDPKSIEAAIIQILDNINKDGGLNAARDAARKVAFMLPILSRSLLSEGQVRAAVGPKELTYPNGQPISEGDMDFLRQKVNNAALLWLQEADASAMDIAHVPDRTPQQVQREAELRALTREQQMHESWAPVYRHMLDRLRDMQAVPEYDTRGHPETKPVETGERLRLARVLAPREARALLKCFPKQGDKEAWEILTEMVQRGASQAQYDKGHGTITAIDGDGCAWDHCFEIEEDIPDVLYREIVDWLTGPARTPEEEERLLSNVNVFAEHINIRPEMVAYLIGYRAKTGRAPVLYSSTMEARFHALAKTLATKKTTKPVVREFFRALLGIDFYGWREQDIEKAIDTAIAEKQIITRTQIGEYVNRLLERYRDAHLNPLAKGPDGQPLFTDEERHDLLLILKNGGDLHCKYRGLLPYRTLFDDRGANAWHAVSANRKGHYDEPARTIELRPFAGPPTEVRVYQPQRFTDNFLQRFIATQSSGPEPHSHVKARLNQGRDGSLTAVLRASERHLEADPLDVPAWTCVARSRRPKKAKGYRDDAVVIPIHRSDTRGTYLEVAQTAKEMATSMVSDLKAMARAEEKAMAEAAGQLAKVLDDTSLRVVGASAVRIKNAVSRLRPKQGTFKPLVKHSEQTMVERAIQQLQPEHQTQAKELLRVLLERRIYSDQVRALQVREERSETDKSGLLDQVAKTFLWLGSMVQHQAAGAIGNELPRTRGGQLALKVATWLPSRLGIKSAREVELLLDLGRSLTEPDYKMAPQPMIEAYGVVGKIIGPELLHWALEKLATDERVPAVTRLELRRHQGIVDSHIRQVGEKLRDRAQKARGIAEADTGVGAALMGAGHVWEGVDELRDPLGGILEAGAGTAFKALVVGVINGLIDDVRTQRRARGESVPDDNMEVGQQLLDQLFEELILLSGGDKNPVGTFLQRTRIRLDEVGFETAMRRIARLFDDLDWPKRRSMLQSLVHLLFPSERNAYDILTKLKEDGPDRAQALLTEQARLMAVQDGTEDGVTRFQRLAEALWRHSDPEDRETIRKLVEQVHGVIFDPKAIESRGSLAAGLA